MGRMSEIIDAAAGKANSAQTKALGCMGFQIEQCGDCGCLIGLECEGVCDECVKNRLEKAGIR